MSSNHEEPSTDGQAPPNDQSSSHIQSTPMTNMASTNLTPVRPASLGECPMEVLEMIIAHGFERKDVNALARCHPDLYRWLNPLLYKENVSEGSTALYWAAAKGRVGTVQLMINNGADIHCASNSHSVRYLREKMYDRDFFTGTALHIAVLFEDSAGTEAMRLEYRSVIDLLVKEDVDLGQRLRSTSRSGVVRERHNSLDLTLARSNHSLLCHLVEQGADVNAPDEDGQRLIDTMMDNRLNHFGKWTFKEQAFWLNIILMMGAEIRPPVLPERSVPPLEKAFQWAGGHISAGDHLSSEGRVLLDMFILDYGADINDRLAYWNGTTSLHVASILGFTEIVKHLLSCGADVEARDEDNRTPLFWATSLTNRKVKDLCPMSFYEYTNSWHNHHQGDIDLVWRGNVEVVKLLLEYGADPEAEAEEGINCHAYTGKSKTPQMVAADNTNPSFRAAFGGGLVKKKEEAEQGDKYSKGAGGKESVQEGSIREHRSGVMAMTRDGLKIKRGWTI